MVQTRQVKIQQGIHQTMHKDLSQHTTQQYHRGTTEQENEPSWSQILSYIT